MNYFQITCAVALPTNKTRTNKDRYHQSRLRLPRTGSDTKEEEEEEEEENGMRYGLQQRLWTH